MQALHVKDHSTQPLGSSLDEARRLLDSFAAGRVNGERLSEGLVELCAADPDVSWAVLAWLDQYHRRKVLGTALFRDLKDRIARLAVPMQPVPQSATDGPRPESPETEIEEPDPGPDSVPAPVSGTRGEPSTERVEPVPAQAPLGPGAVLRERYELVAELGRGGMGAVYRARDRERRGLSGLGEHVALKLLREDWVARPEALAALRHECFRAQSLSHPNVVNIYDWDRDGDTCFVTMELVDGEPLSRILDRVRPRRLARKHALAILEAVGEALVHAHSNGVVHADLKPANVMVSHHGRVKVLDFGLARPVLREPSVEGHGGVALLRAATPAYASPEVLRGQNAVPRDDVFSFACLAYELLGGRPPFERQTVKEARRGRPLPARPRGMSGRTWRAIRRGLAPQREGRQAYISELLETLLDEPVGRVPPLKALIEAAREPRGARWPWALAAAVLALAATGLFAWRAGLLPPMPQSDGASGNGGRPVTASQEPDATEPASGLLAREPQALSDEEPEIVIEEVAPAIVERSGPSAVEPSEATPEVAATGQPVPAGEPVPAATEDANVADPVRPSAATGPPAISLAPARVTVNESAGVARLTITRTGRLDRAVDVRWWTEPGEATSDDDYADLGPRTERLEAGQSSATLLVPLVADAVREFTETFSVVIAADAEVRVGTDRATVIVVDDD
ncbi:MAG TPA: protein kinase [Steroidobacteraceae bacterium]|nr:protein kinase [Steroidobacteraceae bacterium]